MGRGISLDQQSGRPLFVMAAGAPDYASLWSLEELVDPDFRVGVTDDLTYASGNLHKVR